MRKLTYSLACLMLVFSSGLRADVRVLPQFAVGDGWYTALYFHNSSNVAVQFDVAFIGDSGLPLFAPIQNVGTVSQVRVQIQPGQTAVIETAPRQDLLQGYARFDLPSGIIGYGVFRQSVQGRSVQEAVVPLEPVGNRQATLLWDERGLTTSFAVMNPGTSPTMISLQARDTSGQWISSTTIALAAGEKRALAMRTLPGFSEMIGRTGAAYFVASEGGQVAVLGLRFGAEAFTSIPVASYSIPLIPGQALPPAPALQGSAVSGSQVHLTWTSAAASTLAHKLERRPSSGTSFVEVASIASGTTQYLDSGLTSGASYVYRLRTQTATGYSGYSNEVSVALTGNLPAAPTELRVTSVLSDSVELQWRNNAPDATGIRVESRAGASSNPFVDIGPAPTLTSTRITGLAPNTAYTFRVRAQNQGGHSGYSNEVTAMTPAPTTTVFLLHGIRQGARNMESLKRTLAAGLDASKFAIDSGFDYSSCAANSACSPSCTISNGARQLASEILARTLPGSSVILIGYSMGGLIARDLIVNNYQNINSTRHIVGLITLGTPHLGYPYGRFDTTLLGSSLAGVCPLQLEQMASDFRVNQASLSVTMSLYLNDLTSRWGMLSSISRPPYWLAISGGYCKDPIRTGDLTWSVGCPDYNKTSDGVVCDQSARYFFSGTNIPTHRWYGDPYTHSESAILCGGLTFSSGGAPLLSDPILGDDLSRVLWDAIGSR